MKKDWSTFTFIDLFAGIGGIRLGFEAVGGKCVFSSEIDPDACRTYQANFGETPSGDITKTDADSIPDFDILLGGFPCQSFSIIGKKEGFANETCGTLFFDIERILKAKRPPAFMLENVRNLAAHDGGRTFKIIHDHLEALGYHVYADILNAMDYGVPQKRERIIIVGFLDDVAFEFPPPIPLLKRRSLKDILEQDVPKEYYVREPIRQSRLQRLRNKNYPKPYISHENVSGCVTPHHYSSALRAGASANYILVNDERRPTEREMLRIQGFPDSYKIVVPYTQMKKQCGNSVAVPMIKAVAEQMLLSLKNYYGGIRMPTREEAKRALDTVINKSRVHLYKPIQIAEILYRDRVYGDINLLDLEDCRSKSKKWRDDICRVLLGRVCTSSARFQDDLFNPNAVPPVMINELGIENRRTRGAVEAYIYNRFINKHTQLAEALSYCRQSDRDTFSVKHFIDSFWRQAGLKRSLDKVYEIVVYALFSTLVDALDLKVKVYVDADRHDLLSEFSDFTRKAVCIDSTSPTYVQNARLYRVGVTNAADRGLDMYSNWGPAIQIKHLSLDEELAENIVESVSSDKIVIVCKDIEKGAILSSLTQLGWSSHIQSIVTESDLVDWYERALRGTYRDILAEPLLECLCKEISLEFPSVDNIPQTIKDRHYEKLNDPFWS